MRRGSLFQLIVQLYRQNVLLLFLCLAKTLRRFCISITRRCFDTVGWAAFELYKVGCWFVDGDDLTGPLHVL